MGRTWRTLDIKMGVGILVVHLLALFAPFRFTWGAFFAGFTTYVLCGIFGITLSYHRILAHHSLKLPKWLEYTFAYLGVLALYHHQYVDSEKDPHSPTFGFWFSHMGWLFDSGYILEKYQERKNVEDLKNQVFYRFIRRSCLLHSFAFTTIVYVLGYLVWVVGVATTWGYHVTFLVNSACHIWGNQAWNTARHGLEWWQINFCWYMIRFLEAVGLATNVKLPTDNHKLKKSFASLNKFK
ncbi:hypothetical protein L1987_87803 [Smallanthus sonchifolius]|nr:hypothetical protein L1987_87803 [Smallanthus sonchifolius]